LGHDSASAAQLTKSLWTRDVTAAPDRRALARMVFPKLLGFT
jgi:hypothetical protein